MSAFDTQEGGGHYKKLKIQPMQYSMANGLDACQHTIVKYVTRFRDKGGIEDLKKAKHCIDMLIELEGDRHAMTPGYIEYPDAPDSDDWIPWSGGECPVDGGRRVEVKFPDGDKGIDYASCYSWLHEPHDVSVADIIAYRVLD